MGFDEVMMTMMLLLLSKTCEVVEDLSTSTCQGVSDKDGKKAKKTYVESSCCDEQSRHSLNLFKHSEDREVMSHCKDGVG